MVTVNLTKQKLGSATKRRNESRGKERKKVELKKIVNQKIDGKQIKRIDLGKIRLNEKDAENK